MSTTPRPWALAGTLLVMAQDTRELIATMEGNDTRRLANGLLIVRAANAHDALVEAVGRLIPYALGRIRTMEREGPRDGFVVAAVLNDVERARLALKLVEEGS